MPTFTPFPLHSQRGASSLENAVAIMVFLLITLAAVESAHWLVLRQALNTALLDTARIAATQQAHPQIIHEAFTATLEKLPSFAFKAHWHIEKIAPASHQAKSIQHNYQALQYQQGDTQVFEDNTLHLRLHYLHKPFTPLVRAVIYAYAKGHVFIVTDVKVAMQSDHPIWQEQTPTPSWLTTVTSPSPSKSPNTPIGPSPTPTAPRLPPWQPSTPPTAWQPPNGNSSPPWESCNSDFCCAPADVSI